VPSRKTIRNLYWLSELRVAGYGVEQEQVDAGQLAGELRGGRRTLETLEHRQTYSVASGPVARDTVADHPEPEAAEREDRMPSQGSSVATATLEFWSVIPPLPMQGGSTMIVSFRDLYFLVTCKGWGVCARSENVSLRVLWQLVLIGEPDSAIAGGCELRIFADQESHSRTRHVDGIP